MKDLIDPTLIRFPYSSKTNKKEPVITNALILFVKEYEYEEERVIYLGGICHMSDEFKTYRTDCISGNVTFLMKNEPNILRREQLLSMEILRQVFKFKQ